MWKRRLVWLPGIIGLAFLALLMEERRGFLDVGTKAPRFTATLSDGSTASLESFAGKSNVVLFFYPRDFTAGCTAQACSMRDGYAEIQKFDAVVFGVSDDGEASHLRFRERYALPFELIADTGRILIKAYGAERLPWILKSTKRVSYVIDKEGIIRLVAHHELSMSDHLDDVLKALRSLEGGSTHQD